MTKTVTKTAEQLCEEIIEALSHFDKYGEAADNHYRMIIRVNARRLLMLLAGKGHKYTNNLLTGAWHKDESN